MGEMLEKVLYALQERAQESIAYLEEEHINAEEYHAITKYITSTSDSLIDTIGKVQAMFDEIEKSDLDDNKIRTVIKVADIERFIGFIKKPTAKP